MQFNLGGVDLGFEHADKWKRGFYVLSFTVEVYEVCVRLLIRRNMFKLNIQIMLENEDKLQF